MLNFTRLTKDNYIKKDYFENSPVSFCDLSVGVKYMWRNEFLIDFAFCEDGTLIVKESCREYENAFYFPIGNAEVGLKEIEEYCLKTGVPLKFCCIDNERASFLAERYAKVYIHNNRDWSDYIYDGQSFCTFSGKKYGGQRNHINKFKKLYPDYKVHEFTRADLPKIKKFLSEYESGQDFSNWSKAEEEKKVYELFEKAEELSLSGIYITVGERVISISLGEVVKDTLIVHIEKALRGFEGAYVLTAQEYAKAFLGRAKFINREEDCGDMGLRTSKLQYHPIEIKEKNVVEVLPFFDSISFPKLSDGDLEICDHSEKDKKRFAELYLDDENNRFWGYDYREELGGKKPTADYFYKFMQSLKEKKEEYSLAVKFKGNLIGECVFYEFDYFGLEIGYRIIKEYQNRGLGKRTVALLIKYALSIGAKRIKVRCFKENIASKKIIADFGFFKTKEDGEKEYFVLEKSKLK